MNYCPSVCLLTKSHNLCGFHEPTKDLIRFESIAQIYNAYQPITEVRYSKMKQNQHKNESRYRMTAY